MTKLSVFLRLLLILSYLNQYLGNASSPPPNAARKEEGEGFMNNLFEVANKVGKAAKKLGPVMETAKENAKNALNIASKAYAPVYRSRAADILDPIPSDSYEKLPIELLTDFVRAFELSDKIYHGGEGDWHPLSVGSDSKPDCAAIYEFETQTLWVVSRGTHTSSDVLSDVTWIASTGKIGNLDLPIGAVQRASDANKQLEAYLQRLLEEEKKPVKRIVFVGHSLGGAVATALYLRRHLGSDSYKTKGSVLTSTSKPSKYGNIPSAAITIGSPLVLSNPPRNKPITPPPISRQQSDKYCSSATDRKGKKKSVLPPYPHYPPAGGNGAAGDHNLRDLASAVHNIVVQLDLVPRLLGPHPLPTYIMKSKLTELAHRLMDVGVHRETYRPFGHYYSLREERGGGRGRGGRANRGFEFTFGEAAVRAEEQDDENEEGFDEEPLLAYVNDPASELLSKFPNNPSDLVYGIYRDHSLESHAKRSMKIAFEQATDAAAGEQSSCNKE